MIEQPEPTLPDTDAWRARLDQHEDSSEGVWLVLAKKGTTAPTSLDYAGALQKALGSQGRYQVLHPLMIAASPTPGR